MIDNLEGRIFRVALYAVGIGAYILALLIGPFGGPTLDRATMQGFQLVSLGTVCFTLYYVTDRLGGGEGGE